MKKLLAIALTSAFTAGIFGGTAQAAPRKKVAELWSKKGKSVKRRLPRGVKGGGKMAIIDGYNKYKPLKGKKILPSMGKPKGTKGVFPSIVGKIKGTKGVFPSIVGKVKGTKGVFPSIVGKVKGTKGILPSMRNPKGTKGILPSMRNPKGTKGILPSMRNPKGGKR